MANNELLTPTVGVFKFAENIRFCRVVPLLGSGHLVMSILLIKTRPLAAQ